MSPQTKKIGRAALSSEMASFEVPPSTQESLALVSGPSFSDASFQAVVAAVFECLHNPKADSSVYFRALDCFEIVEILF